MAIYRINVAKQVVENIGKPFGPYYRHYFAAELDDFEERALKVFNDIKSHYPSPDFEVTCTKWETYGIRIG